MIIRFFKRGSQGGAAPALNYLLRKDDPVGYLEGTNDSKGTKRSAKPTVLRGDPEKIRNVIDCLKTKWRYTSGVLSLHEGERFSPNLAQRAMAEFEKAAFAGLEPNDFTILWVHHTDAKCDHLHFLVPRVNLRTGTALNIAPPGSSRIYDLVRSKISEEFGLADPDDPNHTRDASLHEFVDRISSTSSAGRTVTNKLLKDTITRHTQRIRNEGKIRTQSDSVTLLKQSGLDVTRVGQNYVTVKHPSTGRRVRLRDSLFSKNIPAATKPNRSEPEILEAELQKLLESRIKYNQARFPKPTPVPPQNLISKTPLNDRTRELSDHRPEQARTRRQRSREAHEKTDSNLGAAAELWLRTIQQTLKTARRVGETIARVKAPIISHRKNSQPSQRETTQKERDKQIRAAVDRWLHPKSFSKKHLKTTTTIDSKIAQPFLPLDARHAKALKQTLNRTNPDYHYLIQNGYRVTTVSHFDKNGIATFRTYPTPSNQWQCLEQWEHAFPSARELRRRKGIQKKSQRESPRKLEPQLEL